METTQTTLKLRLNGAPVTAAPGTTLGALLDARGVERRMIAVEHNREILPRWQWDETVLRDGDELEIVTMVGGG
jgi:sulfur carrier protein